ncbi:hypothetical protein V2K69_04820 [Pseudomonas alliivorans]|nr:hypothetical protein [Pseudomonas alliivorans]MEE4720361.1 hypothetical protein [Pseudomonas alliivorans]MEE4755977.1 hypothetical protein [Pseudomonas alliivorans]MEE4761778.1 hypothetical protein [Pseudomonas alliivorans]MEE4771949.1 hypothetical protein [Pseudomonas alliivorans]
MNNRCKIVPFALLERLAKIDKLLCPDQSAAVQELRDLITSPTHLPLDDDLRYILGRANFSCMSIAQGLRLLGYEIPENSEDEQAVAIHWMLSHYLRDPANWRQNASEEFHSKSEC